MQQGFFIRAIPVGVSIPVGKYYWLFCNPQHLCGKGSSVNRSWTRTFCALTLVLGLMPLPAPLSAQSAQQPAHPDMPDAPTPQAPKPMSDVQVTPGIGS